MDTQPSATGHATQARGALRSGWGVATAICLLLFGGWADAQDAGTSTQPPTCGTRDPDDMRPRIGVALGGGGARGIAHVSVLRELEKMQVPVDCIAGTSMGSIVGGLYAAGMSAEELEILVRDTDWAEIFNDSVAREERSFRRKQDDRDGLTTVGIGVRGKRVRISPGLLQGEKILALFERSTARVAGVLDFDRLPIPYRAVATDINTGQAVVLASGSLPLAMRASMSIPGFLQPVSIDGRVLVDGGVVNQVPIDVVRDMGADIVIAVDVGTPLDTLGPDASVLQVVGQISGLLTVGNTRESLATLGTRDILIQPELGSAVATQDFGKADEALAIGDRAAAAASTRLAALAIERETYAPIREGQRSALDPNPRIDFVRFENATPYSDAFLSAQLNVPLGEPLDRDRLEQQILRTYGLGTFASLTYSVAREDDGGTGLVIAAKEKPHGPNYVQLGFSLTNDFSGTYESTLRAALLMSPLSPNGAEARLIAAVGSEPELLAEYYLPMDARARNLLYAAFGYANRSLNVFDAHSNKVARYEVGDVGGTLRLAREFGNHAQLSLGLTRAAGRASVEVGDPELPSVDFQSGALRAQVVVDRLDSLFLPRRGYYAALGYTWSRTGLGADEAFDQLDFDAVAAHSWGPHTIQAGARHHSTVDGEAPLQDLYRVGGRTRLAGYRRNELTGQHYALGFVGYAYQMGEIFGRSAQVGGTLEYGNAWERRGDMDFGDGKLNASGYVGIDSGIGPILFGLGWRSAETNFFLDIGLPF